MITQQEIKEILFYDPETGNFQWIERKKGRRLYSVGTITNHGYLHIAIGGQRYLGHILAWIYVYGAAPTMGLDHINRNKLDNRITNLRLATSAENMANQNVRNDNTSGQSGVTWDKQKNKWKVQIGPAKSRVQKHFANYNDAVVFAKQAAQTIFGAFAPN
jgi:hypothetical protein